MKKLTRDDTEHDKEYVLLADAEKEIEGWKDWATDACATLRSERDEAIEIARKAMETVMQIYGHAQFCDECQSFEIADSCRIQMHGMDRINSLENSQNQ